VATKPSQAEMVGGKGRELFQTMAIDAVTKAKECCSSVTAEEGIGYDGKISE
jgi:hypothetical protein